MDPHVVSSHTKYPAMALTNPCVVGAQQCDQSMYLNTMPSTNVKTDSVGTSSSIPKETSTCSTARHHFSMAPCCTDEKGFGFKARRSVRSEVTAHCGGQRNFRLKHKKLTHTPRPCSNNSVFSKCRDRSSD